MKKKSLSFKIALIFITCILSVLLLFGCESAGNTDGKKDGLQLTLKANIASATVSGGGYYQKNEDVSISVNTPDGYKFLGWYYDQDLISSSAKYNLKMWDKDVTLDAKFVANITYGDSDGSSSSSSSSSWYSLTVKSNSRKNGDISVSASNLNSGYAHKYEESVTIGYNIKVTALTKTSIRFLGWYDGIDTLVMPNASFEFMMPSTDFILIAKWAEGDEIIKNNVKYEEQDDGTYAVTGVSDKDAEKLTIESSINKKAVSLIEKAAFVNCKNLKSISIPESIQEIGNGAFGGCKELTNISIPNDEIRIGNNTFNGCPIETASIPTDLISYIPKQKLKTLIITGGTSIGSNTFFDCSGLTSVTIPDSVLSIGDSAFGGCSGLTRITIPDSVTSIGSSAFSGCSGLTSITIPNSVTSIGDWAFSDCSKLTSVTIPDSVTSIGEYAFSGCSGLEKISVVAGNTKYHSAGNCLIETKTKTLIAGCKNSVIPTDGSVTFIGDYAFCDCSGLTSVTIGDSVTSIGWYAFSGCSGLTSVTIGDSVTSIGWYAFSGCSGLTSITIGNSVTSIGLDAFSDCRGLETVYYKGTADDWNKFDGRYNNELTSATRYYYSETKPEVEGNFWHYNDNGEIEEW